LGVSDVFEVLEKQLWTSFHETGLLLAQAVKCYNKFCNTSVFEKLCFQTNP
jgi:hypothetical protein